MKNPTSIRISDEAKQMLKELVAHLGVSQTGVLEMAVREFYLSKIKKEKQS